MYYNKAILIGFVGGDPIVRYLQRGSCQATLSLATTVSGYTKRDGRQVPARTEWHTVVLFGTQAQFVERWVRKGSHLLVEGEIRYNSYMDRQGAKHARTEIWADKVTFVDSSKVGELDITATSGLSAHHSMGSSSDSRGVSK